MAGLAALLAPACAGTPSRAHAVRLSLPVEVVQVRVTTPALEPSGSAPLVASATARPPVADDALRPAARRLRPRWRLGEPGGMGPPAPPVEPPEEERPSLGDPQNLMTNQGLGIHLGVGEAPYDDGLHDNALLPTDIVGFSDALVQVYYVQPVLGGAAEVVGAVSATRVQDDPLTQVLEDPNLAWITVGLKVRF